MAYHPLTFCLLFENDIVLVDEIRYKVNVKLKIWRDALESKGFRLSKTETGYIEFKFSKSRKKYEGVERLNGQ